jgi:peptidoglycan/LPS O-acetylase OafA/YrhL
LYIPELDGLRFVAILFVFVFHLAGDIVRRFPRVSTPPSSPLFALTQTLNVGVPLFFALSGMIMGLPFARYWLQGGERVSLKRYLLRRVTRLEPPYIAAMLLLFTAKVIAHRGTVQGTLPHLGASLIYLHGLVYREMSSINPVAWSLEVEVQFYLLAPALAMVFAIRNTAQRRSLICIAAALAAILEPWKDMIASRADSSTWMAHLSIAGNIQYFLAGFLLADFFLHWAGDRNRRWDVVSLAGWPCFAFLLVSYPRLASVALPGIIILLCVAVFRGTITSRLFSGLCVTSVGGMCYSIYLLHNYIIATLGFLTRGIAEKLPFGAKLIMESLIVAPIVLTVSIVFYRCIEQPCMNSDWPTRVGKFALGLRRRIRTGAVRG